MSWFLSYWKDDLLAKQLGDMHENETPNAPDYERLEFLYICNNHNSERTRKLLLTKKKSAIIMITDFMVETVGIEPMTS